MGYPSRMEGRRGNDRGSRREDRGGLHSGKRDRGYQHGGRTSINPHSAGRKENSLSALLAPVPDRQMPAWNEGAPMNQGGRFGKMGEQHMQNVPNYRPSGQGAMPNRMPAPYPRQMQKSREEVPWYGGAAQNQKMPGTNEMDGSGWSADGLREDIDAVQYYVDVMGNGRR